MLSPEVAELTGHWQLFIETLVRGYQCASYLVQENIETERGRLACSHRPEMDKVSDKPDLSIRYCGLHSCHLSLLYSSHIFYLYCTTHMTITTVLHCTPPISSSLLYTSHVFYLYLLYFLSPPPSPLLPLGDEFHTSWGWSFSTVEIRYDTVHSISLVSHLSHHHQHPSNP